MTTIQVPNDYTKRKVELLLDYYGSYDAMKPFMIHKANGTWSPPPLPANYQFLLDMEYDPKTLSPYKKPFNISILLFKLATQEFKYAFQ